MSDNVYNGKTEDPVRYTTSSNFGLYICSNKTVLEVVNGLVEYYEKGKAVAASDPNAVHKNTLLNLDTTNDYIILNWEGKWNSTKIIQKAVDWYKEASKSDDMYGFCSKQLLEHGGYNG